LYAEWTGRGRVVLDGRHAGPTLPVASVGPAGVDYQSESGTWIYFRDPDGARLELIADPLGEMYGSRVM
jgi:hypothetical protein